MPPRRIRDRLPGIRQLARHHPLPSLYDRHPRAASALRRARGLQIVPIDQIVGTVRHPTQNSADFLPLPGLRGKNWEARWQRIERAIDDLSTLPPVDLVKVGNEYYVADGHNRVAAALKAGAVAIDADVVELAVPGMEGSSAAPSQGTASSLLAGTDELRRAAAGQLSRTAEHRSNLDGITRRELTVNPDASPRESEDDE
jgi:hypothetical protein